MEATQDIHQHMIQQMREQEELRREQADLDQKLLKQRIIQDQKVWLIRGGGFFGGAIGSEHVFVAIVSQPAVGEGSKSSKGGQATAGVSQESDGWEKGKGKSWERRAMQLHQDQHKPTQGTVHAVKETHKII